MNGNRRPLQLYYNDAEMQESAGNHGKNMKPTAD